MWSRCFGCIFFIWALGCAPTHHGGVPSLPGGGTENLQASGFGPLDSQGGVKSNDPWATARLINLDTPLPPKVIETPSHRDFVLANGLNVIVFKDTFQPVVTMQLAFRVGARNASLNKRGIAKLAAQSVLRDGRIRKGVPMVQTIAAVGGELSIQSGYETTTVRCQVMKDDARLCMSVLNQLAQKPSLTSKNVEMERKKMMQEVLDRQRDSAGLADTYFQHALWGNEHPRGRPVSALTLKGISRQDILDWHTTWFRPSNAVLAVNGDIDPRVLGPQLESTFRSWKSKRIPRTKNVQPPERKGIQVVLIDQPGAGTSHIRLGHEGVAGSDPDALALKLVNQILGGEGGDSLFAKSSSVSSNNRATSHLSLDREQGSFVIKATTETANTLTTIENLLDQLAAISSEGISQNGLKRALMFLTGRHSLKFDSSLSFASAFLAAKLHPWPINQVEDFGAQLASVSLEKARSVAKEHFSPKDLMIVVVGDASGIEDDLTRQGWTYTKQNAGQPIAASERQHANAEEEPVASKAERDKAHIILTMAMEAKGLTRKEIKTLSWKGRAVLDSPQGKVPATVKKRLQEPGRMRLDMRIGDGQIEVTSVVTETKGWVKQKNNTKDDLTDLPAPEAASLRAQLWRDPDIVLTRFLEDNTEARYVGRRTFHGKRVHVIRLSHASDKVTLFVAKKGMMLLGMEYSEHELKARETYSDYRRVKGIQIAHQRAASSAESDLNFTIGEISINEKISPLVFLKPSGTLKPKVSN